MPARDIYHNTVKNALIKDGWTITHDPFKLEIGKKDLYIDLGAEQLIAAEKLERKIAVEVKSFVGKSEVNDLENALGQYILYNDVMVEEQPERALYLAVRETVFNEIFEEPIGKIILKNNRLMLIVFEPQKEVILRWIP
ncbi:MAG: XisH family protein [Nostocaceae cyanobacterium]|nr:XisH family protein [Nostocaceae cyanobacterium]